MSEWKRVTPLWSFRQPGPRKGTPVPHRRKLRLDSAHQRGLVPAPEDRMRDDEEGVEIAEFWRRIRAGLDRYAAPIAWAVVAVLVTIAVWALITPPLAKPIPAPGADALSKMLDPNYVPAPRTSDGRKARYVQDQPRDNQPEPPLDLNAKGGPR